MAQNPVKSGKNLSVTFNSIVVGNCTDWTVEEVVDDLKYASSSTGGLTSRVPGVVDATGTFKVLTDQMPSGMVQGAIATLVLVSDTVAGTTVFNGQAILSKVSYTVNVTGKPEASVTWGRV